MGQNVPKTLAEITEAAENPKINNGNLCSNQRGKK